MMPKLRSTLLGCAVCALIYANASAVRAGTIIKLNLGDVTPDLTMTAGVLGTSNDGSAGTTGDQDTDVVYTDFLEPIPDINTPIASFTLSNLLTSGTATIFAGPPQLVSQNFSGGTFSLYDASNTLLLSGSLTTSSLTGTLGVPGAGGLLTTNVASVTGGTLADFIVTDSLALSLTLSNVNGGNGFSVAGEVLDSFIADSVVSISGNPTELGEGLPEPGTLVLATMALVAAAAARRRAQ